jgi:hypothetical protein
MSEDLVEQLRHAGLAVERRPGSRVTWTRLPREVAEALVRAAERRGESRSAFIARAVTRALEELGELDGGRACGEDLVDPFTSEANP